MFLNVSVNNYKVSIPQWCSHLSSKVKGFQAGCIADHLHQWCSLTSDKEVLDIVSRMYIEFEEPPQVPYRPSKFSLTEHQIVKREINKLLSKGVMKNWNTKTVKLSRPFSLQKKQMDLFN